MDSGNYVRGKCGVNTTCSKLCTKPCTTGSDLYTVSSDLNTCTCNAAAKSFCGAFTTCVSSACACVLGSKKLAPTDNACVPDVFNQTVYDSEETAFSFTNQSLYDSAISKIVTKLKLPSGVYNPADRTNIINRFVEFFYYNVPLQDTDLKKLLQNYSIPSRRRLLQRNNDKRHTLRNSAEERQIETGVEVHEHNFNSPTSVRRHMMSLDGCRKDLITIAKELLCLHFKYIPFKTNVRANAVAIKSFVNTLVDNNKASLQDGFLKDWSQYANGDVDKKQFYVAVLVTVLTELDWDDYTTAIIGNSPNPSAELLMNGVTFLNYILATYATDGYIFVDGLNRPNRQSLPAAEAIIEQYYVSLVECTNEFPMIPCNDVVIGGQSVTTQTFMIEMGARSGKFNFSYNMQQVPDLMELWYENKRLWTTNTYVLGKDLALLGPYNGTTDIIAVRVKAPFDTTTWRFKVTCPKP